MSMGIHGVPPQQIPVEAQYTALGHVHKPQTVRSSPAACYPGSLLQLDFGEVEQQKYVNLVEVHAGAPAEVTQLPIQAGRPLRDIGTAARGVHLDELRAEADRAGDAWLRVFVDVDLPIANLAAMVREALPGAVHIERTRKELRAAEGEISLARLTPEELFRQFYRSDLGRQHEPPAETVALFRQLLDEETWNEE
jgi:exonuclease SbcD